MVQLKKNGGSICYVQCSSLEKLLKNMDNIHHEDIKSFKFIPVGGNWKRGAYDKDCCVYLMMLMMVFHGVETVQDGVGIFDFDPLADVSFCVKNN